MSPSASWAWVWCPKCGAHTSGWKAKCEVCEARLVDAAAPPLNAKCSLPSTQPEQSGSEERDPDFEPIGTVHYRLYRAWESERCCVKREEVLGIFENREQEREYMLDTKDSRS